MTNYKGRIYKSDIYMPVEVYVEYYMVEMGFRRYKNPVATEIYIRARHKSLNDWTKESRTAERQAFLQTELPEAVRQREVRFNKLYKKVG